MVGDEVGAEDCRVDKMDDGMMKVLLFASSCFKLY